MKPRGTRFLAIAAPPLVWLLVFFLVPLAVIWAYSFGTNTSLVAIDISGSLANYARAVEPLYLGIIAKSFWYAGLTTLVCLVLGFPVAVAITFASDRAKPWLLLAIMLPFWTNLLVRTYALMAVLRSDGYLNWLLALFWSPVAFLGGPAFRPIELLHTDFAVVFGLVYVQLPFMVLPLYAALDRIDRSLIEASLDLGAGHIVTFCRIVVPLALPSAPDARPAAGWPWRDTALALAMVAAMTAVAQVLSSFVGVNAVDLLYLVPVIASASLFGLRPSLVASVAAARGDKSARLPIGVATM